MAITILTSVATWQQLYKTRTGLSYSTAGPLIVPICRTSAKQTCIAGATGRVCCLQKVPLPELPSHAKYVHHQNECYDWGTYGWLLRGSGHVDYTAYRYFFFINSSVRGPFLPAYARVRSWYRYCHQPHSCVVYSAVNHPISCHKQPCSTATARLQVRQA